MKKVVILSIVLLTSLFVIGCPNDPTMRCTPLYQCVDGSMFEYCVSLDGTRAAYRYHGHDYYCTDIYYGSDCDEALRAAYSCLGYISGDLGITDRDQVLDQPNVEMQVE